MIIKLADFDDRAVIELLNEHLSGMHENSPAGSVYALDYSELQDSSISFWTAWEEGSLLGCGALKQLSADHGEIKSMRTQKNHLRKGVAAKLLAHIMKVARQRNYRRLRLETGTGEAFDPAVTLYEKHGFVGGEQFGDYQSSDFNQFLHLDLA